MKLSIITVNLNNRDGLQKTIDSVISQTFQDFEWIVIDGGSTDGSKELIEQYAEHFAYWVSEPDKGIYNAMNKGIKVAKGEYLQFLNSGDWLWDSNVLQKVFSNNFDGEILYGDIALVQDSEPVSIRKFNNQLRFSSLYELSLGHQSSFIQTKLLKEEPYDENYKIASDYKFFIRKAIEGKIFQHVDVVIACFDMSGFSNTNLDLTEFERVSIGESEIPALVLSDCKDIFNQRFDWQLVSFQEYRHKRKLYHQILTFSLRLIKLIDKLSLKK